MHALLLAWLGFTESDERDSKALIEPVALHLKELSASDMSSQTIVAYLTSQMESLAGVLQ